MAITVNGQILRNLPEQVSKNTEDILDLQDTTNLQGDKIAALENSIITDITLNNLEVTGNTVIGNTGSDTLTVTGASSFAGNVDVTGNVTASGDVTTDGGASLEETYNVLSGAENVDDYFLNEGDITMENLPANLDCNYAHWRISNKKLSIVMSFFIARNATVSSVAAGTQIASITIPSWAGALLYSVDGAPSGTIDYKEVTIGGLYDYLDSSNEKIGLRVLKASNTNITISCYIPAIEASTYAGRAGRAEFNFTL